MKNFFRLLKQRFTWLFYGAKLEIHSLGQDSSIHNCMFVGNGIPIIFMPSKKNQLSVTKNIFLGKKDNQIYKDMIETLKNDGE